MNSRNALYSCGLAHSVHAVTQDISVIGDENGRTLDHQG